MKKITHKFVTDHLARLRIPLKNQSWHDFMDTEEAEAVSFALYELGRRCNYSDIPEIIQTAQLYLLENSKFSDKNLELVTTPSQFFPHKATCRLCNAIWQHTKKGAYLCPNGHSHLYCTRIA